MFILSHPLFWGSIAVIYLFFFSHRWDPMASKLSSLSWCGQSNLDAASEGNLKLENIFFQTGINPSPKKKGYFSEILNPYPLKTPGRGFHGFHFVICWQLIKGPGVHREGRLTHGSRLVSMPCLHYTRNPCEYIFLNVYTHIHHHLSMGSHRLVCIKILGC